MGSSSAANLIELQANDFARGVTGLNGQAGRDSLNRPPGSLGRGQPDLLKKSCARRPRIGCGASTPLTRYEVAQNSLL
jgi:hypothetical protein